MVVNAQFRTRTTNNWFDLLIVFDNGGLSIGEWHTNASTVLLNEWQHVAVTFDASSPANDPLIYINGVSQTVAQEDAPSGTFPTATAPWVIGNVSNQQATFDGYLDEVRLYDRILTPEEVELLYRMGQ